MNWFHWLINRLSGADTQKIVRDNQKATQRLQAFDGHLILNDIDDLIKGKPDEQNRR